MTARRVRDMCHCPGFPYRGAAYVRVLTGVPGVQVTFGDADADRLAEAAARLPTVPPAADLSAVVDDGAALVATPPGDHADIARQATEADASRVGWGVHYRVLNPRQTAFAEFADQALPGTERAAKRILSPPQALTPTDDQADRVCDVISGAIW